MKNRILKSSLMEKYFEVNFEVFIFSILVPKKNRIETKSSDITETQKNGKYIQ